MKRDTGAATFFLCFPLAVLVVLTASLGIFADDLYVRETENWKSQSIAQDMFNLIIIAPVLLTSSSFSFFKKRTGIFITVGTLLFLIYSFTIYCFSVHFNQLFLVYCLILGLSVYIFAFLMSSLSATLVSEWFDEKIPTKITSRFLILVALLFCFLWLREIIPAMIQNKTPKSIETAGLLTNPVQVLDLSIFLPAFIFIACFLLKKNKIAIMLTPIVLVFFVLMNLNMIFILIKSSGDQRVFSMIVIVGFLFFASIILLFVFLNRLKKKSTMLSFTHFYGDESYS